MQIDTALVKVPLVRVADHGSFWQSMAYLVAFLVVAILSYKMGKRSAEEP